MKQSWLPLAAMGLVGLAAITLIRPNPDVGRDGPAVSTGIFEQANKARLREKSLPLDATFAVTTSGGPIAAQNWALIMLGAYDRHPATHALMYAIGECMAVTDRGVFFDPLPGPHDPHVAPAPLPMQALVSMHMRGDVRPTLIDQPITLSWALTITTPQPPPAHPAGGLLPPAAHPTATMAITAVIRGLGPDAPKKSSWPGWWAAVGRSAADIFISQLALSASRPAVAFPDWGSIIPEPPANSAIRWQSAFQDELARGYIGIIASATTENRTGTRISTIESLEKLVGNTQTGKGQWSGQPTTADGTRLWVRPHGDSRFTLSATPRADGGWDLVFWQEATQPAARFQEWVMTASATAAGVSSAAAARTRVLRHLECWRIPADLRAKARTALARADSPAAALSSAPAAELFPASAAALSTAPAAELSTAPAAALFPASATAAPASAAAP